jgi:hypothetical protein
MQLTLAAATGYLRAELAGRRTAEETRLAHAEVIAACRRLRIYSVLAVVRGSVPIFKVEQYGLSATLQSLKAGGEPGQRLEHRVFTAHSCSSTRAR